MTQKSPDRDTTIEDIHATRRRIAEKFGHDLAAIVQDAQKRQATSGHEFWRPKPKPSAASPNP
jgi:(p)ppGpp synthase/HD superfamily hydrolase